MGFGKVETQRPQSGSWSEDSCARARPLAASSSSAVWCHWPLKRRSAPIAIRSKESTVTASIELLPPPSRLLVIVVLLLLSSLLLPADVLFIVVGALA